MRKFAAIVAIATAIVSAPANAGGMDQATLDNLCNSMSAYAGSVMKSRQAGVPIDQTIAVARRQANASGVDMSMFMPIILEAYENPLFNTAEYKHRSVMEFKNKIMTDCYRTFGR